MCRETKNLVWLALSRIHCLPEVCLWRREYISSTLIQATAWQSQGPSVQLQWRRTGASITKGGTKCPLRLKFYLSVCSPSHFYHLSERGSSRRIMLESLCTEKLQLHTERNASLLKEWHHQWGGVTAKEKLTNPAGEASASRNEGQPGLGRGAVLPRTGLQAGRPAWDHPATSLRGAHQAVETLLLPLGPRGPDPARGLHYGLPQALTAGRWGGCLEQSAPTAPGWPHASPRPRAGPKQAVLLCRRPTRCPRHAGLPLVLLPLLPGGQSVQAEHFGDTAEQVSQWGQDMAIHWDPRQWRLTILRDERDCRSMWGQDMAVHWDPQTWRPRGSSCTSWGVSRTAALEVGHTHHLSVTTEICTNS